MFSTSEKGGVLEGKSITKGLWRDSKDVVRAFFRPGDQIKGLPVCILYH
jgi:hypothetical protein